ncbi:MAG TPA: MraY family glycosyltransferase [Egibacteraceae bacterium]|nr:MraY family glycosyltransferase [Egibacteraceae bacterium]
MIEYLAVFATALATVLIVTPVVRWLAPRLGAVAEPGDRHVHTAKTPTMGGVALFAGILAAIGVASFLPSFRAVFSQTSEPEAIVLASLVLLAVGMLDDTRGISAPAKLASQILAAGILVLFGLSLLFVYIPGNPGSVVSLGSDLGALFTVVVIVAMINAVNLVDGLDGLAAGVVAIGAIALFIYVEFYVQFAEATTVVTVSSASLLLAAIAGACIGFLVYNFHPASIFMGDTGAMLLGFLLAAAGVSAIRGIVSPSRGTFAALSVPALVPVLVLAVPFLDTAWTIIRRLGRGRAVFAPDKEHLHHRLLEIGNSHRRAVLVMYYWSALLAFAGVGVSFLSEQVVLGVVAGGVGLAIAYALVPRVVRRIRPVRSSSTSASGDPAARQRQDFVSFFTKWRARGSENRP